MELPHGGWHPYGFATQPPKQALRVISLISAICMLCFTIGCQESVERLRTNPYARVVFFLFSIKRLAKLFTVDESIIFGTNWQN